MLSFDDAACLGQQKLMMDPDRKDESRALCLKCPIIDMCAEYSLKEPQMVGMVAGVWRNGSWDDLDDRKNAIAAQAERAGKPISSKQITTKATPKPWFRDSDIRWDASVAEFKGMVTDFPEGMDSKWRRKCSWCYDMFFTYDPKASYCGHECLTEYRRTERAPAGTFALA